jgi:hypothetical protein
MRLAIADPPYLPGPGRDPRGSLYYGPPNGTRDHFGQGRGQKGLQLIGGGHPEAALWNKKETHEALVQRLVADYDGWVIAMMPNNLADYLRWVPKATRVCVWAKTQSLPTGSRVKTDWEPVLLYIPEGRRERIKGLVVHDVLIATSPRNGFVGAKPREWTRWVLDMMGYDQDEDEVDDLFPGSGLVADEISQGVLPIE